MSTHSYSYLIWGSTQPRSLDRRAAGKASSGGRETIEMVAGFRSARFIEPQLIPNLKVGVNEISSTRS
jgi:hypothetical protein